MSDGLVPWRQNSAVFLLLSFCFLDNRCSSSSYTTITVWLCGNSYDGARWIWKVSATANCRRLEYAHQLLNKRPDTVLSWLTPLLAIVAGLYGYAKVELVGVWLESFTLVRVTLKLSGKKKIQPLWIIMNTITPWSRDSLSLLKEIFFFFKCYSAEFLSLFSDQVTNQEHPFLINQLQVHTSDRTNYTIQKTEVSLHHSCCFFICYIILSYCDLVGAWYLWG